MAKQKLEYISGLDIGTSKIACVIAAKKEEGGLDIIGVGATPCASMRRGMVADIEETVSAISNSLEQAERMAGVPVDRVFASISGAHIESSNSKGVIAISGPSGEVMGEDVERAIEAAKAISGPANREILHVLPRNYIVDGQEGISEAVGMTGIRLEVETHIISGSTPAIKNLTKCIMQAGLNINELTFSGLAGAEVILNKKQREIGVGILDLGAGTTSLTVFEEGNILHSAVIPIGSAHITNDIAIGLKTSLPVADRVKIEYGSADSENVNEREMIDLSKIDKDEEQAANKKYLSEIIEARMSEILTMVKDELKGISRDGMLPAGMVLTGGGSKIEGLNDLAKETLRLPVSMGEVNLELTGLSEKVTDPIFNTVLGLVVFGMKYGGEKGSAFSFSAFSGASSKVKGFLKQLLPK